MGMQETDSMTSLLHLTRGTIARRGEWWMSLAPVELISGIGRETPVRQTQTDHGLSAVIEWQGLLSFKTEALVFLLKHRFFQIANATVARSGSVPAKNR